MFRDSNRNERFIDFMKGWLAGGLAIDFVIAFLRQVFFTGILVLCIVWAFKGCPGVN